MASTTRNSLMQFFILFTLIVNGQTQNALHFIGHNFYEEKELTNTTINVYSGKTKISSINTEKSNNFKMVLPYGKIYDMYFINSNCKTAFLRIFGDIPPEKRETKITYELNIPFFANDPSLFDTSQFSKPFHQVIFNGKNKFVDDTIYMSKFLTNLIKKETEEKVSNSTTAKEYHQLVGKLSFDNDKQTPLKNKSVSLINKNGEVISTSQTTNLGIIIFQRVDLSQTEGLRIKLNDIDNPNKENIKLQNSQSELIAVSKINSLSEYELKKSPENDVIKKMIDKNFKYNVGGKLLGTEKGVTKIVTNKLVYLLDEKNNTVQKTKTNELGTFLFSKINANQNYSIAFDKSDTDLKLSIYTTKDKLISQIDSIKNKQFVFKFLTTSSSTFNDLVIDDSELKMKIRGKLYGDNKNNPITNLKVYILNNKYEAIDSTMTNNEGSFTVDNISYLKNMSLSANNVNNILESFNNILVFDNAENLIKIVALQKDKRFNFKPLALELNKLTESYIDDPWLKIIRRKQENKWVKNETIIESILFDSDKADLLKQSQQTLDKIIMVMATNQNFKIELSAFSDSKGSDSYNLKLSESRANSAKDYMVSKGIDAKRISAFGYGETKLLNNCTNTILCSEDEHAVNRRIEFKLIFE